ncbi:MAG TPA: ABC transporter permease, partial [Bacteroidetes bacterium]|nr:ABC transporter permease [Bacteroidota bacterium]
YESVVFAPIPYSATTPDIRNIYKGPFDAQKTESWRYRHWLGTDGLGHDLAASLLAGARVAILVGVVSMSIATVIGLLFGALAGYFGDDGFRISRGRLVLNGAGLLAGWFYAFQVRGYVLSEAIQHRGLGVELMKSLVLFAGIMALANGLVYFTKKIKWLKKRVGLPLDLLIMRAIEVVNSIPGLLLLLALVAVMPKSSILYVMVIIGLIRWQSIARFLRAELLRIRNLNYIEAGRALGYSHRRILFGHALPNAIGPVLITVAFGMASAVLLESALSFLGIGIGAEGMTWGRLLAGARHHPSAWWLALFPGGAIFITVTALNLLGEALSEE